MMVVYPMRILSEQEIWVIFLMRIPYEGLRYSPHAVWVMDVVFPNSMRILSEQEIWVIFLMRIPYEGLRYSPHAVWVMKVVYPMRIHIAQELKVISPYEKPLRRAQIKPTCSVGNEGSIP
jgi:hypothetical protein